MGTATSLAIIEYVIQYGVLGILGYIAIKNFITQSNATNMYFKKLLEYVTKEKRDKEDEILSSLAIVTQTINKNLDNNTKIKYEIMAELQRLNSILKDMETDRDKSEVVTFKMEEIQNSIIKNLKNLDTMINPKDMKPY